jgi:putative salt-induced outer membrane protein YdiY
MIGHRTAPPSLRARRSSAVCCHRPAAIRPAAIRPAATGLFSLLFATLTVFTLAVAAPAARADVVHLANGDRLTGSVAGLTDGELTLSTAYASELKIDWSQVSALVTDGPLTVELDDGRRLRGVAAEAPDGVAEGTLTLRPPTPEETATETAESAKIAQSTVVSEPLTLPFAAVAGLNPPRVPGTFWSGSVSASVSSTSGNTDSDRTYLAGELVARAEPHRVTLGADLNQASEDGVDTVSRTHAYLRYDRFFGPRWYLDANASATEDQFQDLDLRTTIGLAAGHQISDDDTLRLGIELGVSYVEEDFQLAADDSYAAGRWSLELSRHFGGGIELFHSQELLVSLDDSADRLLRTRTGLRFDLWKSFVAAVQLNYDRDEKPSPGREKSDQAWLLNLGYTW